MDGLTYVRALLRSWWLILIVVVAGAAGGYLIYHRQTPLYQSSVRLVVAPTSSKTDAVSAQALTGAQAQALAQVAGTPPGIAAAAAKAGLPGANPAVSAYAPSNQPFVTINVIDPNPRVAQAIANALVDTVNSTKVKLLGGNAVGYTINKISAASDPGDPISPDIKRDLGFGLAAGLVLGLALALLRETLNRTVRDTADLQRLTGLTVLGTVPRDLPKVLLPAASHPRSARAEAYRQIRTTLQSSSRRRPLVIAVTSATLGEGKTSVATNLAAVFSRAGHRVALVDADLRRPRVADFFELTPEFGLTDVLTGEIPLERALVVRDEGRLGVLPAGRIPTNPSEALGSAAMEQVLDELGADYEFVIIDTPPVLPVTDALVLAPAVHGVVLVARLGRTTRDRIQRAQAAIRRVNGTVLGVVPNHAGRGTDADYQYPYRYTPSGRGINESETSVPESTMHRPERASGAHAAPDDLPASGPGAMDVTRDNSPTVVDGPPDSAAPDDAAPPPHRSGVG